MSPGAGFDPPDPPTTEGLRLPKQYVCMFSNIYLQYDRSKLEKTAVCVKMLSVPFPSTDSQSTNTQFCKQTIDNCTWVGKLRKPSATVDSPIVPTVIQDKIMNS